jgi:hypothetical protein
MTYFRLPRWVINRIDKIKRDFLWGNHKTRQKEGALDKLANGVHTKEMGQIGDQGS